MVGGGECVESVRKFKVVDKVVKVCVIGEVRWYDMVGLVSRCWSRGRE